MIIGITGLASSGKDVAAHYLETKGFHHISLADILRGEATKRGASHSRESLHHLATALKKGQGFDILARKAIARIKDGNYVISAFRHPSEVKTFHELPGFRLVYINAPAQLRYDRAKSRQRAGDTTDSFEQFLALERPERRGGYEQGQSLDAVIKMADDTIDNSRDIAHLYAQINALVKKLTKK